MNLLAIREDNISRNERFLKELFSSSADSSVVAATGVVRQVNPGNLDYKSSKLKAKLCVSSYPGRGHEIDRLINAILAVSDKHFSKSLISQLSVSAFESFICNNFRRT
jgi:hypothetical protein